MYKAPHERPLSLKISLHFIKVLYSGCRRYTRLTRNTPSYQKVSKQTFKDEQPLTGSSRMVNKLCRMLKDEEQAAGPF